MEEIFKRVENVLDNYPNEWTKNYYKNKKSLKINVTGKYVKGIAGLHGAYDGNKNSIEVKTLDSLPHELFHMAFQDSTKFHTRIFPNYENPLYDNGLFMCVKNGEDSMLINRGINEGFVEYLARKCGKKCGQDINYYFADLLISIFGEDILKYAFTCDPIGFYADRRFDYINIFTSNLDDVNDNIFFLIALHKNVQDNNIPKEKYKDTMDSIIAAYNYSLIETFESILDEYDKCEDKLICREELNKKLCNFIGSYDFYNSFNNDRYSVKRYVKGNIR